VLRVAWWMVVAWAALYAVGSFWYAFGLPDPGEIGGTLLVYGVLFVVLAKYVRSRLGEPWRELVPLRRFDPLLAIPVVLLTLGGWVVSHQLVYSCVALNVLPPEVVDLAGSPASTSTSDQPLGTALVSGALFPGFFEEVLFRGLVLQALASMMSRRRAIAVSALCFAIVHFRIERMPDIILGGLVYGWMALRTGSLWPSIVAHALHDAVCVLLDHGVFVEDLQAGMDDYGLLPAEWVWAAVAMIVVGLLWIRAATRARRNEPAPVLIASRYRVHGLPARPLAAAPSVRA
jgi:membrane protease YdiL (CAAX protease family)